MRNLGHLTGSHFSRHRRFADGFPPWHLAHPNVGIVLAPFITLFLLPVLYLIVDDPNKGMRAYLGKSKAQAPFYSAPNLRCLPLYSSTAACRSPWRKSGHIFFTITISE